MSHASRTETILQWSFVRSHPNLTSGRAVTCPKPLTRNSSVWTKGRRLHASTWRSPYREGLKLTRQPHAAPFVCSGVRRTPSWARKGRNEWNPGPLLLLEGPSLIFTRWLPAPHPSDLTDKAPPHMTLFYSPHRTLQHQDCYTYISVYPCAPFMPGSPTPRPYCPLPPLDYKLLEGRWPDRLMHPCIPQRRMAQSKCSLNVLGLRLKYDRFLSSDKWAKLHNVK